MESFSRFTSVAVTVQSAAEATGNGAMRLITSKAPAAAIGTIREWRNAPDRR
jgi:hypothetical protein